MFSWSCSQLGGEPRTLPAVVTPEMLQNAGTVGAERLRKRWEHAPCGRLVGQLLDHASTRPDARLVIMIGDDSTSTTTVTDADGNFSAPMPMYGRLWIALKGDAKMTVFQTLSPPREVSIRLVVLTEPSQKQRARRLVVVHTNHVGSTCAEVPGS